MLFSGWDGKNRTYPGRVKVCCPTTRLHPKMWGGRWDSNPRSSVPQTDALGQLRYTHHIGAPEGTRTPGPLLRRQVLYPAELQAPVCPNGRFFWSGWWESNPHNQLGRLGFYHWTTPAYSLVTAWIMIPYHNGNVKHKFYKFWQKIFRWTNHIYIEKLFFIWYSNY